MGGWLDVDQVVTKVRMESVDMRSSGRKMVFVCLRVWFMVLEAELVSCREAMTIREFGF